MNQNTIQKEIIRYGRKLTEKGFICGHGGNISVRVGDKIFITRRGASLEELTKRDIIRIDIFKDTKNIKYASSEAIVHREIYKRTNNKAIIHTHGIYSIAVSYFHKEIEPLEIEVRYTIKKIPVIEGRTGTLQLGRNAAQAIKEYKTAIIRGHGIITAGETLEEAYRLTCLIEKNSQEKYLLEILKNLGKPLITPKEI